MKRIKSIFFLALAFTIFSINANAQIDMPRPSPTATLSTKVGLTDVKVEYSRPGVKGREKQIFAKDGLVPYGKVWRTGANEATKVTFSDAVTIGGKELPAGTYGLYTIPNPDEWTVVFSKNTDLWGAMGYKEDEDVLRVKVKPVTLTSPRETFTIDFSNYTDSTANMNIMWDYTQVPVQITSSVDKKVMAQIQEKVENPLMYYQAANYYYTTNKDMKQALEWVNKAVNKREHYVFYNLKSKILANMKDYKEAIKAAEKSKELAQKANNPEYVKMNDQLIADYKAKK